MSKTEDLKKIGYKTLKQIGKENNRELRKEDIPEYILKDGIRLNGVLYPPEVVKQIEEYIKIPSTLKQEFTNMRKYGVKSTSQLKEIKTKQLETLKKNYNVSVPSKSKEVSNKISKTALSKHNKIENRCYLSHNDKLIVCSDYTGENKNIILYCNDCGNLFKRLAKNINLDCPYCSNKKNSIETFIVKANKIHKGRYLYNNIKYINNKTPVYIFCKKCNKYFQQTPNDHLNGHGHSCYKSKQEENLADWFTQKNIKFEREYSFDDCRGKRNKLPFDFYLPNYDLLIEVQGEFHFKGKNLDNRQKIDLIKKEYAEKYHKFKEIFYYENELEVISKLLNK